MAPCEWAKIQSSRVWLVLISRRASLIASHEELEAMLRHGRSEVSGCYRREVFDAKDELFGPEVDLLLAKVLITKVREGDAVAIACVTKNGADLRSLTKYVRDNEPLSPRS